MWQLELGCELIDMAKGVIIASFYSQQDYLKVLEEGPWMVMGSYLAISKWRPNFTPNDPISSTTLIWVRVPDIPIEMFKEKILMRMGNKIGRAVKVDITLVAVVRGNFARICVEVDLSKPLKPNMMILGRVLIVEYEGLQKICFHCGYNGYILANYPKLAPPLEQCATHQPTENANENNQAVTDNTSPFGSWMMPEYVRRRQQQQQKRMQQKTTISEANRKMNGQLDQERSTG